MLAEKREEFSGRQCSGRSVVRPPSGEGVHDLHDAANQNWNKMPAAPAPAPVADLGDQQASGMHRMDP
jgi:hypothetical protein